jgi:hypothetical protein
MRILEEKVVLLFVWRTRFGLHGCFPRLYKPVTEAEAVHESTHRDHVPADLWSLEPPKVLNISS